ncbi:hypothetical protein ACFWGD_09530 [Corynebacterium sp. NPDC060344]|uniref:hypothetical protein n=1 Tax=Corynebacterium sp. NPDC060344 TaxID=3347101 RepID=UPI003653F25C
MGEGGGRVASSSNDEVPRTWPPPPWTVPRTRAEMIAGHGIGAERSWTRVRQGMYLPRDVDVTPQVTALAEVRARPSATLSGATAARAWGHPWVAACVPEIVLVPRVPAEASKRAAAGGQGDGITVITSSRRPVHGTERCVLSIDAAAAGAKGGSANGGGAEVSIPIASVVDVTIDCVAALPDDEAIAFLDGALRAWGIGDQLRTWAGSSRRAGAKRMRELLDWADWRAESRPESLLRTKLRRAGQGQWVPQFMVNVASGKRWVDLGDPDYRIDLEFLGQGHWQDAEARRADAQRVNELREVGWTIIEVTILDVFRDFDQLLERIEQHRRRIDAERARDLAWRRNKTVEAARRIVNRWFS